MEPCFVSTEDWGYDDGRATLTGLQWSRASSARKTRDAPAGRNNCICFNGAVLRQHGRLPPSQRLLLAAFNDATASIRRKRAITRADFDPRIAVSAELSKNASIPRTSLHHRRTRGRDEQLCRREYARLANGFTSALVNRGDASLHFQPPIRLIRMQWRRK